MPPIPRLILDMFKEVALSLSKIKQTRTRTTTRSDPMVRTVRVTAWIMRTARVMAWILRTTRVMASRHLRVHRWIINHCGGREPPNAKAMNPLRIGREIHYGKFEALLYRRRYRPERL